MNTQKTGRDKWYKGKLNKKKKKVCAYFMDKKCIFSVLLLCKHDFVKALCRVNYSWSKKVSRALHDTTLQQKTTETTHQDFPLLP